MILPKKARKPCEFQRFLPKKRPPTPRTRQDWGTGYGGIALSGGASRRVASSTSHNSFTGAVRTPHRSWEKPSCKQSKPEHSSFEHCSAARKRRASSHNHITSPQWHHWHRYFKLRLQVETTASFSSWQFQFRGARVEMRVPCEGGGCFFTRFKLKKFLCA